MGDIRALKTVVNNTVEVHAILDPGSMVVAISEACAIAAEIAWDESKSMGLQSANNTSNATLGEARDVPFTFGGSITVYMQVQVVRDPAYDILLGRPFDVLCNTVVTNVGNHQTIRITDPNRDDGSESTLTLATLKRVPVRFRVGDREKPPPVPPAEPPVPANLASAYLFRWTELPLAFP